MTYHVNRQGQDLGVCSLEQLKARRASGDYNGTEAVWTQGMTHWQTINSVLGFGKAGASGGGRSESGLLIAGIIGLFVLVTLVMAGVGIYNAMKRPEFRRILSQLPQNTRSSGTNGFSGILAATKPVKIEPGTRTFREAREITKEFEKRQFLEGYKLRGQTNAELDNAALKLLNGWIQRHVDDGQDAKLSSLSKTGDQLAADTNCTDPVVLTVVALSAVQINEATRRLERAEEAFKDSKHLGYPKFYAAIMLGDHVDENYRLLAVDGEALLALHDALSDGSILQVDQNELAEFLVYGDGKRFFERNALGVCKTVKSFGTNYHWLALALEGDREIDAAWRVRGGGFAGTVTDAGWTGFHEHMTQAQTNLTEAWKLHPEWALAASRMIYVSLGEDGIDEMRTWFDRATAAQIDYPDAWTQMRWGLRPRWYGDLNSMLAFGVTAVNTRRFDTDVPRIFYDSVHDVEAEMQLSAGEHIYRRRDIWPHFADMYNGYISACQDEGRLKDGWRTAYATIAYLGEKYDVARQQLEALKWKPQGGMTGYGKDLTLMPMEVAARTGAKAGTVNMAENMRDSRDAGGAIDIYNTIAADNSVDERTRAFARDRLVVLKIEKRLHGGEWVSILPTDENLTGWNVSMGKCKLLADGALEVESGQHGHLLYSRVHAGKNFEMRGQFEVVSSTTTSFQGGVVMGMPEEDEYGWYAFRIKRNPDEGEVALFSQAFSRRDSVILKAPVNDVANTFDFTYHDGRFSAVVNGMKVFNNHPRLKDAYVNPGEFLIGLGAFNNSNATTLRYRNVEVREIPAAGSSVASGKN